MFHIRSKGKTIKLDGEEEYFYVCSSCGKLEYISDDEFFDWCREPGIYEISAIYCNLCSGKPSLKVIK